MHIKKLFTLLMASLLSVPALKAQLGNLMKSVSKDSSVNKIIGDFSHGSLSTDEVVAGLKEALEKGTKKSTHQLSSVNGFLQNAAVKILLPPEAEKAEKALRSAGLGKLADDAITSMNHAAEDA